MSSPPRIPPLLQNRPRPLGDSSRASDATVGTTISGDQSDHSHLPQSNLLLAGLDVSTLVSTNSSFLSSAPADAENEIVPPRPRRLWKVHDTKLPLFPSHLYPPPNKQNSCFVSDAPPSVIAVRIAECLRRRSVAVEYDEETCTATAVTVDRCALTIYLWRSGATTVLVECVRSRGPLATFHWTTRAILQAAQSLDSGSDTREWTQATPGEFPRIFGSTSARPVLPPQEQQIKQQLGTQNIVQSLEEAVQLLNKDRLGAQLLGMESVVALTDWHCTGLDAALYAALAVLGVPCTEEANSFLQELHSEWIYRLLVERRLPTEPVPEDLSESQSPSAERDTSVAVSSLAASAVEANASSAGSRSLAIEDHHAGLMRSLALIAVTNSFSLLAEHQPTLLHTVLTAQAPQWTRPALIQALTDDLQGAHRPPTVVQGTRLAGAHEAVLAVRCLEHLGKHVKTIQRDEAILALLDGARTVGRSTHEVLYQEANRVYGQVTEEERSC